MGSLKSSGSTRVVDSLSNGVYSEPGFLLFVRDETLLAQRFDLARMTLIDEPVVVANGMGTGAGNGRAAFAASRNGVLAYRPQSGGVYTTTLTWFDRSGKSLGPVGSPNLHRAIAVSPDGTRVAAQIGWTVGSDIWVTDFIRGIPTRLTSDPSNEEWPVWSPDGTRIAFASNRDGSVFNIFDMPADGSAAPHLLFQSDRSKKPVQWSNDGHWLLFDSNGIYALPLDGNRTPIAIGSGTRQASFAKVSPDGAWVAYASDETGRSEIFLQRFPSPSGRWPVSNNGGTRPHWRGDGRELYYLGFDNQLYAVPVTPASPPVIGAAKALFPVRLTSAPTGATMFDGIEPSSDGQRFLINLAGESASPQAVTVKVNWPLTLKR
jgi:Tol biopolymer transport system component